MSPKELNDIVGAMRAIYQDNPHLAAETLVEWTADFWTGDIEENVWEWTRPDSPVLRAARQITKTTTAQPKGNNMRTRKPRKTSRRAQRPRTARQFGKRGLGRRNRPGALNPAAKQIQALQEQLQAGDITSEEFESQMEQLEAQQKHSHVVRRAIARARRSVRRTSSLRGDSASDTFSAIEFRANEALDRYWDNSDDSDLVSGLSDVRDMAREGLVDEGHYAATRRSVRRTSSLRGDSASDTFSAIEFRANEALDRYWDNSDDSDLVSGLSDVRDMAREGLVDEGHYAATRTAAIDPADVVLLNNAVKQLSKMEDADHAVRMLRDIIDASQEMMKELSS